MSRDNLTDEQYIKHLEGKVAEFDWTSGEPVYTIGVDFDRTLAYYNPEQGQVLGEPIPAMLARVKDWIKDGKTVVIFTKRAARSDQIPLIQEWCVKHGLPRLAVTNVKLPELKEIWDDISISVEKNTGAFLDANNGQDNTH
jgi:hypothetical protein